MECVKIIEILTPLIVGGFVAWLTYLYAIKKLKKEMVVALEQRKYEKILEAHKSVYRLIRYITDTENEDFILVWERPKGGKTQDNIYYFRKENIRKYMNELVEIFYKNGNGVFLSPKISDLLFEYRGIVYGLMYATRNNESERIEIQKKQLVERMLQIKNELSKTIRENINLKSRDLLSIED